MAAVEHGIIDETSNAVPFDGFFGKTFYFYYLLSPCFRKCNFTSVFICFFICQSTFFIFSSALNIIQGFSLNFARTKDEQLTSCCMVQWLLYTGSLFLESKARVCFEATWLSNK